MEDKWVGNRYYGRWMSLPRLSMATTQNKRLSGKQGPRTLVLNEDCTNRVLEYLDKDEPKAHRAVARRFVGERRRRSFLLFKEPLKMMMAAQSMDSVMYPLERFSRNDVLFNISSSYSHLANVSRQYLTASVQEEEYDEVETHQCDLCGVDGELWRDGEDTMVESRVAVADLHTFLNIHSLPLRAKSSCLKNWKYLELSICVGDERVRRTCYNRFLLDDDMMDMRDAPFWHED